MPYFSGGKIRNVNIPSTQRGCKETAERLFGQGLSGHAGNCTLATAEERGTMREKL